MTTEQIRAQIEELKAALKQGGYPSRDAYEDDKFLLIKLEGKLVGLTPREYDPMGVWHGLQSN